MQNAKIVGYTANIEYSVMEYISSWKIYHI